MEQRVNAKKSKRICNARKLDMEGLKEDVNEHRDLYQYERAKKFKVSQNCIHKGLKRLGVSYKKTFQHPKASEEERMLFKNKIEKYELENRVLSYIDESGFAFDIPRRYGYSKVGDRCYGSYNWNAKGRENIIGALINNSLIACATVHGNIDSDTFNTWLEKILIPELPKNSVVIMDNASFHKSLMTKEILTKHGHDLEFLPPYSPDFNPIEHKWAQAKAIRKKHNCSTLKLFQKYLL